jgi:hypothetical protein
MEQVTMYRSKDGKIHNSKSEALIRDFVIAIGVTPDYQASPSYVIEKAIQNETKFLELIAAVKGK